MQSKKSQRSKRKGAEKEFWPLQQVLGLWWKLSLDDSKGVYPCKYMDGYEKSKETKLQTKNTFYNKLNMKGKSDNEYKQLSASLKYHWEKRLRLLSRYVLNNRHFTVGRIF